MPTIFKRDDEWKRQAARVRRADVRNREDWMGHVASDEGVNRIPRTVNLGNLDGQTKAVRHSAGFGTNST